MCKSGQQRLSIEDSLMRTICVTGGKAYTFKEEIYSLLKACEKEQGGEVDHDRVYNDVAEGRAILWLFLDEHRWSVEDSMIVYFAEECSVKTAFVLSLAGRMEGVMQHELMLDDWAARNGVHFWELSVATQSLARLFARWQYQPSAITMRRAVGKGV